MLWPFNERKEKQLIGDRVLQEYWWHTLDDIMEDNMISVETGLDQEDVTIPTPAPSLHAIPVVKQAGACWDHHRRRYHH